MNTIKELKHQEKYDNMLKRKNKEKNIYKNKNSTLRIEKMNLIKAIERKEKEIERLNNIIKELKLCNTVYYNNCSRLSSKLSLINRYISNSEHELSVDSYYKFKDLCEFDEIKRIIFDKIIDKNIERSEINSER